MAILSQVVREGHIEKVTLDQEVERGETASHKDLWEKIVQAEGITNARTPVCEQSWHV